MNDDNDSGILGPKKRPAPYEKISSAVNQLIFVLIEILLFRNSFQIAQKVYYHIKSKEKQEAEDLKGIFDVYGDEGELSEDLKLPSKESLGSEIEKLMKNC